MKELLNYPWALSKDYLPVALHAFSKVKKAEDVPAQPDPVREGATVVMPLQGILTPRRSYFGTGSFDFAETIRACASNPKIGAIVLDVDSPGGVTYGIEEAALAVFEARKSKPVVAVANAMACSAAYWIASQASAFYATPSADVGSVGVYSMHMDMSKALETEGLSVTLISAGEKKVDGNPFEPLTDRAKADIQASVNESYQQFLNAIARGRGITAAEVEEKHGQGAIVSAKKASGLGMIDGVMTLREAITKISSSRNRLSLLRRRAEAMENSYI